MIARSKPRDEEGTGARAAAYYPETNVLVPLGSTALESATPTSSVVVSLEGAEA